MSAALPAGLLAQAAELVIEREPLPAEQVLDGAPAAGLAELGDFAGVAFGVWEMTPGTATDTEADEVFIVLRGLARLESRDGSFEPIELRAGSVVALPAGARTVWTVTETLRKVYLA